MLRERESERQDDTCKHEREREWDTCKHLRERERTTGAEDTHTPHYSRETQTHTLLERDTHAHIIGERKTEVGTLVRETEAG